MAYENVKKGVYLNQKIPDEDPLLLQGDLEIQQTTNKLHDLRRL